MEISLGTRSGMYSAIQEASSPTTKFMLIMSFSSIWLTRMNFGTEESSSHRRTLRSSQNTCQQREQLTNRFKNEFFGPEGYRTGSSIKDNQAGKDSS